MRNSGEITTIRANGITYHVNDIVNDACVAKIDEIYTDKVATYSELELESTDGIIARLRGNDLAMSQYHVGQQLHGRTIIALHRYNAPAPIYTYRLLDVAMNVILEIVDMQASVWYTGFEAF